MSQVSLPPSPASLTLGASVTITEAITALEAAAEERPAELG